MPGFAQHAELGHERNSELSQVFGACLSTQRLSQHQCTIRPQSIGTSSSETYTATWTIISHRSHARYISAYNLVYDLR